MHPPCVACPACRPHWWVWGFGHVRNSGINELTSRAARLTDLTIKFSYTRTERDSDSSISMLLNGTSRWPQEIVSPTVRRAVFMGKNFYGGHGDPHGVQRLAMPNLESLVSNNYGHEIRALRHSIGLGDLPQFRDFGNSGADVAAWLKDLCAALCSTTCPRFRSLYDGCHFARTGDTWFQCCGVVEGDKCKEAKETGRHYM